MPRLGLRHRVRASALSTDTTRHGDSLASLLCLKSLSELQTEAVGPKSARSEAVPLAKGAGQIEGFSIIV
jgi:hypothetical protein